MVLRHSSHRHQLGRQDPARRAVPHRRHPPGEAGLPQTQELRRGREGLRHDQHPSRGGHHGRPSQPILWPHPLLHHHRRDAPRRSVHDLALRSAAHGRRRHGSLAHRPVRPPAVRPCLPLRLPHEHPPRSSPRHPHKPGRHEFRPHPPLPSVLKARLPAAHHRGLRLRQDPHDPGNLRDQRQDVGAQGRHQERDEELLRRRSLPAPRPQEHRDAQRHGRGDLPEQVRLPHGKKRQLEGPHKRRHPQEALGHSRRRKRHGQQPDAEPGTIHRGRYFKQGQDQQEHGRQQGREEPDHDPHFAPQAKVPDDGQVHV
mmetsp:Transcript_23666/g.44506  ORF Transcript_23666/g.44506 Transcript_23666/m.44506 type:complete len:313 (-) Transcript_23666:35-973(-)